MSITIDRLSYLHPDKESLFTNIGFTVKTGEKAGLTGRNGTGKSTLMQIIAGRLQASSGKVVCRSAPYYVPQQTEKYDNHPVAFALGVQAPLYAFRAILKGEVTETNYRLLNDEWDIEDRVRDALAFWGLDRIEPDRPMVTLSGGEKTKIFLAGIRIHHPEIILLDEPTNHLDDPAREKVYELVTNSPATLLVCSHDRTLLNLADCIFEINRRSIARYGGNYDTYKLLKDRETAAIQNRLNEKEKELRIAEKTARETAERQQKHTNRGKKVSLKKGVPRIAMNTLKNKGEKSSARLNEAHREKEKMLKESLSGLRSSLPDRNRLKANFNSSGLHTGKILISAENINFGYKGRMLWKEPLNFRIRSGERIAVEGKNGSGKTTLLKLIAGNIRPACGQVQRADIRYVYLDQTYSIIRDDLTVSGHAESYNKRRLPGHELKTILDRFLFPQSFWRKKGSELSGGEKMRLALCCLMIANATPDLFILDEPTNNLDLRNMEILSSVVRDYQGTVLLVTHDRYFSEEVGISRRIRL